MRNGSGVQSSPGSSFPAVANTLIESTKFNNVITDINNALTQSVSNDGQTPILANLPMGGFKHTGAAAASANGEYLEYSQRNTIPGKNLLINTNFSVNQKEVSGAVVLAAGEYGHDGFAGGAGGCTYTFATALNVTTLTITAGTLYQLADGQNLQSGTHTLSWTGTALARIGAGAYSASGVTGTAVGGTNQSCEWGTGTLSKVKYEAGAIATLFVPLKYDEYLSECQYYLPAIINQAGYVFAGQCVNPTTAIFTIPFPVKCRVPPTSMSISSQVLSAIWDANSGGVASTSIGLNAATNIAAAIAITIGSNSLVAGNASILNLGATSILFLGAQL